MLFGTRRGAYTEAANQPGYLQSAHGGTLFLDEIADLPLDVQPKLLRVLEGREVTPLGATTPVAIDVGIVAASHRALRVGIAEKRFREDLYFRLAQPTVYLPPLRARKVDIARLVVRELARTDRKLCAHAKLIETCCTRPWPGNIRELLGAVRNAGKQALANGRDVVKPEDLPENAGLYIVSSESETARDKPKQKSEGDVTKAEAEAALASTQGNVTQAAKKLGLHRNGLNRVIAKFGIIRNGKGTNTANNDDNDDDDDDDDD
jgi:transcriptional regulator with PAS, ATPase and Fis domain